MSVGRTPLWKIFGETTYLSCDYRILLLDSVISQQAAGASGSVGAGAAGAIGSNGATAPTADDGTGTGTGAADRVAYDPFERQ